MNWTEWGRSVAGHWTTLKGILPGVGLNPLADLPDELGEGLTAASQE